MRKLENTGIVLGSTLMVDYYKLGYTITAFLGIYLDKSSLYSEVALRLKEVKEVVEANYITGSYSILAKIICRDTNHLHEILRNKIQPIPGIQRTETFISLEETIGRRVEFLEPEKEG
jgi:Lrp/AsnC family transcriptional regulator for asnA, asnC and gidA